MRIDSHQHFWIFDPVRDSWINNKMALIQRDFLPQDLHPILMENNFDACIAVQANQSEAENDFLIKLAGENSFIKGIVGWVNLIDENLQDRLDFYAQQPLVKGFRHVLQGEPQRDFMLQPAFKRGISLLHQYNFTYDILIFNDQIAYAEELVKLFPNQKFIIDHIAKPDIKNQEIASWKSQIMAIAKYPNVSCKVSGMVTEAHWQNWNDEDLIPYLDIVFEAFGIDRLLFGSDWPVCNIAGGYTKYLNTINTYLKQFSKQEQSLFFGENAAQFYHLSK